MKDYPFFATVSRMKYIERWALMRNSRPENLSEHSLEVAQIAHALCIIGNIRYGMNLNADRAAVLAVYHDVSEIITGDLPTPVKYFNDEIESAYRKVESVAVNELLKQLPEDLRDAYHDILHENDDELKKIVKAADKLSALIKCIEEETAGNSEFATAAVSTRKAIEEMIPDCPMVKDFLESFIPDYGRTLDELMGR
ncbi:MAG: 5'-deoxynucleotidase [Erysipelotrichaceae bacterium]|jgi:5'-deoxynucleotidase|nr:5'-deoxynucleotidase [Erysipelotrichaceae bacterium]